MKDLTEELFRYSIILSDNPYNIRENVCLNSALEECIAAYYGAFKASASNRTFSFRLLRSAGN